MLYVVSHILFCIYVIYYPLILKCIIYYILYKYPNKLLHYGKENSWMWGQSICNICHPTDLAG